MTDRPGRVEVLTRAQVESKLAELRADHAAWTRLQTRWGHLGALRDEIDTYQWLIDEENTAEATP